MAEAWEKQATDLAQTSRQYEEYAVQQEMKEKKIKAEVRKGDTSRRSELQEVEVEVNEGVDAAHRYEEEAQAARKEAEGIRANSSWYDQAEKAAAAHTLYAELPKSVIPPPLPPLP